MAVGGVVLQLAAFHILLAVLCDGQFMLRYRQCTYFGEGRTPKEAYSLSNCTWYKEQSCCRHTEVTSVFKAMMPLHTSSTKCNNLINYLMCYFCSPEQEYWYRSGKLHICTTFCDKIYAHCKESKYNGDTIGKKYENGKKFCEAQLFKVVESKYERCFEFDTKLFGSSCCSHASWSLLVVTLFFLVLIHYW